MLIKMDLFVFYTMAVGGFSPAFGYKSSRRLYADMSFHGGESVTHHLSIPRPLENASTTHFKFAGLLPLQTTLTS